MMLLEDQLNASGRRMLRTSDPSRRVDPIYLDNQATTPTDPRVAAQMAEFLRPDRVGNPHSEHFAGRHVANAVEAARKDVADLIGGEPEEIIFTSGATEANNIAIQGIAKALRGKRQHFVTSAAEHKCVLETFEFLRREGCEIDVVPVDRNGLVDLEVLRAKVSDRTALVSIMSANNEIGTIQPVAEIGNICRRHGAIFHTDAAQAAGKISFDVRAIGADLVSLSGHKIYAPIGTGALFVSDESPVRPLPLFYGGGQERGLRSGTLAAHLAIAMGTAATLALSEMETDAARCSALRELFLRKVHDRVPNVRVNAEKAPRLSGNLSLTLPGIDADRLVGALQPDVAISTNAACASGVLQPSHVLLAIGLSLEEAASTIRVGFGRFNSTDDARRAAELLTMRIEQSGGNRAA
jgi:cysteine desulfurase